MGYWRLTIQRPVGQDEVFDLRTSRSIYAGDQVSNDICIDTTLIPGRLKIVSQFFNKVYVRLSDEVSSSISGQFKKKKSWHSGLFSGSLFEISGTSTWKVGDATFSLEKVERIPFASATAVDRSVERKHWLQSIAGSLGSHAALALMLILTALISKSGQPPIALDSIQKIAIADVNKILEEPKPNPVIDAPATVEAATGPSIATPKSDEMKMNPPKTMAQKGKSSAKPSVETMGLLGLQNKMGPKKSNLDVVALASSVNNRKNAKMAPNVELGLAEASGDLTMMAMPSAQQVATLGSSGIQSYQGGLSDKVSKGAKRTASIKLVKREVEVRGGLDPEVIRQIIEERLVEVQSCYATALLDRTTLEGKISATWTIGADGSVTDFKTESDEIKKDVLHPCIAGQIKQWKFPSPKGGGVVHVKYPFLFSPVGS